MMTENDLKIEIERSPAPEDEQVVSRGLQQYNDELAPFDGYATFAVFLRTSAGAVLGGLLAEAGRGWLHLSALWLDPSVRGKGHGTRLMDAAEDEARRRGCHGAYLDTFSFQARPFYERCGVRSIRYARRVPNWASALFYAKGFRSDPASPG